uniref:Uncharacterized protein n=1 Tax=Pararge aegeria TaxID=116150 RepID=S4NG21_9NEOP
MLVGNISEDAIIPSLLYSLSRHVRHKWQELTSVLRSAVTTQNGSSYVGHYEIKMATPILITGRSYTNMFKPNGDKVTSF